MREWLAGATEGDLTVYGLAKAVGKYLDSGRAQQALVECFGVGGNRIRARTARRRMKKMGFSYDEVKGGLCGWPGKRGCGGVLLEVNPL